MKPWLRFPPPLHVLVLIFVLACSAISVIFKTQVLDRSKIERLIERETNTTESQAERIAALLSGSNASRERAATNLMSIMQTYPRLRWAVVCDPQGKILYSTRPRWVGALLSETAPPQATVLTTMVKDSREPAHLVEGHDSVTAIHAVPGTPDAPLQYLALVQRDLSRTIAQRQRNLREETLITSFMLLAYSFLLWFGIFVFLKWRLRDFYRKAGLTGKPSLARALNGGDEFAEIAGLLGEAEHLLHDIGDNLQEVVWIVTPDLKPVYLSPAFEKIHLRKREEAYGNNAMPDYILEEHRDALREAFVSLINGAPSLHLQYRIKRGDGQVRWIETSGCPVRNATGELQRIVGISRDITEQKSLQEELVNASDQERHSLGHDLHDDACQRLAAMKMKCDVLANLLKDQHSPQSAMAMELTNEISDTSVLLRNMARGLAPVEVEGDGLVHALQKLVRMQESIHEVPCYLDARPPVIVENEEVATHLYRIAQELITNAARHGKPTRIDVKVETLSGQVRLTVMNDGQPFRQPAAGDLGMGLKILRYRASAIGATMDIRPRSDGVTGTIAECSVPQAACMEAIPFLAKAVEPMLKKQRSEREAASTA